MEVLSSVGSVARSPILLMQLLSGRSSFISFRAFCSSPLYFSEVSDPLLKIELCLTSSCDPTPDVNLLGSPDLTISRRRLVTLCKPDNIIFFTNPGKSQKSFSSVNITLDQCVFWCAFAKAHQNTSPLNFHFSRFLDVNCMFFEGF